MAKKKEMSQTAGTSSFRDPFSEIAHNDNRAFKVKCGPIQPSLNFPQKQPGRRKYRLKKMVPKIQLGGTFGDQGRIQRGRMWGMHFPHQPISTMFLLLMNNIFP